MSGRKDGGSAFPGEYAERNGMHSTRKVSPKGMTLRDYFAGQAMLMIPHMGNGDELEPREVAHDAYRMADAMLAERDQ